MTTIKCRNLTTISSSGAKSSTREPCSVLCIAWRWVLQRWRLIFLLPTALLKLVLCCTIFCIVRTCDAETQYSFTKTIKCHNPTTISSSGTKSLTREPCSVLSIAWRWVFYRISIKTWVVLINVCTREPCSVSSIAWRWVFYRLSIKTCVCTVLHEHVTLRHSMVFRRQPNATISSSGTKSSTREPCSLLSVAWRWVLNSMIAL